MKNDMKPLYTIHYTDQRGIARELPVLEASLLTHFLNSVILAAGHQLVGVTNHTV